MSVSTRSSSRTPDGGASPEDAVPNVAVLTTSLPNEA